MFATHSSLGVVDLGATKTVIGSNLVADLINNLHPNIRKNLQQCPCHVTFRFGNHSTLQSEQALVVPLQDLLLKIAIVPGSTPFLLSNTLLRAMHAVIDVERHVLWSKKYNQEYPLTLTPKGLFLIDLTDLAANTAKASERGRPAETHLAYSEPPKHASHHVSADSPSVKSCQETNKVKVSCQQGSGLSQTRVTKGPSEHADRRPNGENESAGKESQITMTECPKTCQPPQESFPSVVPRDKTVDSSHVVVEPALAETTGESGRTSAGCVSILHARWRSSSGPSTWVTRFKKSGTTIKEWISWFVKHYQNSTNGAHRLLLRYVELKVERAELEGEVSPTAPPEDAYRGEWEVVPEVDGQSQGSPRSACGIRGPDRLGHRPHHPGVDRSSARFPSSGRENAPPGECRPEHPGPPRADGNPSGPSESCDTRRSVDEHRLEMLGMLAAGDPCSSVYHTEGLEHHTCQERRRFVRLVEQYTEELDKVILANSKQSQTSCRLNLLEVFCGPKSQFDPSSATAWFQSWTHWSWTMWSPVFRR